MKERGFESNYENILKEENGIIEDSDNYQYRVDSLRLFRIIEETMTKYIDALYKTDHDVEEDKDL